MYQGEDAIELVDVDYDPLAAVVDMNDALSEAKGLLFPEAGTNVVCTFGDAAGSNPDLFAGCEVVVSEIIQNRRVAAAPMESRSAAASWGEDGRLTAWIPNQGAQGTKGAIMACSASCPRTCESSPRRRGRLRREVRRRRRARAPPPGYDFHADADYRAHLARVLTKRALEGETG